MVYVKVNETLYPASISGKMQDKEWDGRESKAITMESDFATVDALFPDGVEWSIVMQEEVPAYQTNEWSEPVLDENGDPVLDENGDPVMTNKSETVQVGTEIKQTEYDNGGFYIRGDLIVHVDGTCTVKMGKPTDLEDAYEMIYGGM